MKKAVNIDKSAKEKIGLDEFKRYTGALAEQFQDGLKVFGEQLMGVSEKLTKEISDVKRTQASHSEMIGALSVDVEGLKLDVGVLKTDVGVLKMDMKIVKNDTASIKYEMKAKSDYVDLVALEKRVIKLESR